MQTRNTVSIAFRLRPHDHADLISKSKGNRSLLVKRWLREYLENPEPFPTFDDNLKQSTISVEPELQAAVAKLCEDRQVPIMTLVRQIVERNLRR